MTNYLSNTTIYWDQPLQNLIRGKRISKLYHPVNDTLRFSSIVIFWIVHSQSLYLLVIIIVDQVGNITSVFKNLFYCTAKIYNTNFHYKGMNYFYSCILMTKSDTFRRETRLMKSCWWAGAAKSRSNFFFEEEQSTVPLT